MAFLPTALLTLVLHSSVSGRRMLEDLPHLLEIYTDVFSRTITSANAYAL